MPLPNLIVKGLRGAARLAQKEGVELMAESRPIAMPAAQTPYWLSRSRPEIQPWFKALEDTISTRPTMFQNNVWKNVRVKDFVSMKDVEKQQVADIIEFNFRGKKVHSLDEVKLNPAAVTDQYGTVFNLKDVSPTTYDTAMSIVKAKNEVSQHVRMGRFHKTGVQAPAEDFPDWYFPHYRKGKWQGTVLDQEGKVVAQVGSDSADEVVSQTAKLRGQMGGVKGVVRPRERVFREDSSRMGWDHIQQAYEEGLIDETSMLKLTEDYKKTHGAFRLMKSDDIPGYSTKWNDVWGDFQEFVGWGTRYHARARGWKELRKASGGIPDLNLRNWATEYTTNAMRPGATHWEGLQRSLYGWNIGANTGFLVQNLTQTFLNNIAESSKYVGAGKGSEIYFKSMTESPRYVKAMMTGDWKGIQDREMVRMLRRASDEGAVRGVMTEFLYKGFVPTGPEKVQELGKSALDKALTSFGHMSERVNRTGSFVAGVMTGRERGLKGQTLYLFAKNFVDSTQFPYGKVNKPMALTRLHGSNRKVAETLLTFRHFSINQMNRMVQEVLGAKEFVVAGRKFQRTVSGRMAQVLAPTVLAGASGIPFYQLYKGISNRYGSDPDIAMREWIKNVQLPEVLDHMIGNSLRDAGIHPDEVREKLGDVVTRGVPSLAGIDPSKWIGLGTLPFTSDPLSSQILGVTGGMGEQFGQAIDALSKDRGIDSLIPLLPAALRGPLLARKWNQEGGVRAPDGELIYTPSEWNKIMRAMNIPPLEVGRARDLRYSEKSMIKHKSRLTSAYAEQLARAIAEGDGARADGIRARIAFHNEKAPDHMKVKVNRLAIRERVREIRGQRTLRRVPKTMRGRVREIRAMRDGGSGGG